MLTAIPILNVSKKPDANHKNRIKKMLPQFLGYPTFFFFFFFWAQMKESSIASYPTFLVVVCMQKSSSSTYR